MNNRLRTDIQEEEAEKVLIVDEKPVRQIPDNFLTQLFTKGILTTDRATKMLPFILYVAFLGMIYIGNRHQTEKDIRAIDKLNKDVKELEWDYKTTKADLAYTGTLSEVAKRVDTLGIKE